MGRTVAKGRAALPEEINLEESARELQEYYQEMDDNYWEGADDYDPSDLD